MVHVQHYELLGSRPQLDSNFDLERDVALWKRAHGPAKHVGGTKLACAAEHFFGLTLDDYRDMNQLVDAMMAMNSELAVH